MENSVTVVPTAQVIDVSQTGKSLYPTQDDLVDGVQFTGWHKGKIAPGDFIMINPTPKPDGVRFEVREILERRDHRGSFPDPADKEGSFFKVICNKRATKSIMEPSANK